ncbi:MAG: hypothetical protein ACR2QV_01275, partial [Gammaproteobacteria bacterium]
LMMGFNDGIPKYGIHHQLWPNEIAEKMAPFLLAMINSMLVKEHGDGENDWLTNESDEYIRDHIGNMIAYSKMIKNGCKKHALTYFDTSEDFSGAIEAATDFLVGDLN